MPSGKKHYRLTLADVSAAHQRALSFGGLDGIANPGMIEAAIARPYTGYYRTIERKAAALTESMSSNHGFLDGNKRTTLILLHVLLSKSGYKLSPTDGDPPLQVAVEEMILAIVNHEMDYDGLVEWFKLRIEPV